MRTLAAIAFTLAALGFTACGTEPEKFHNVLSGKTCTPDITTFAQLGDPHSHHPGCDANHCCVDQGGECDGHPDAGDGSGGSGGSGSGSGSGSGPF